MPAQPVFEQPERNQPSRKLQHQLADLRQQLSSASNERDTYRIQLKSAEADLEKLRSTVANRDAEVAERDAELTATRAELATARAELNAHLNRAEIWRSQLKTPIGFGTHFVQPANEIYRLLAQAQTYPDREKLFLAEAAVIVCQTLMRIQRDTDLPLHETLVDNQNKYRRDFTAVTDDPDQFWLFVAAEHDVLLAGGLSKQVTQETLLECLDVVKNLREGKIDPQGMDRALRALRHKGCNLANLLQRQIQEEKTRKHAKTTLRKIFVGGVIGVVMNAIDYYALGLPDFNPLFPGTSIWLASGLAGVFAELVTSNGEPQLR